MMRMSVGALATAGSSFFCGKAVRHLGQSYRSSHLWLELGRDEGSARDSTPELSFPSPVGFCSQNSPFSAVSNLRSHYRPARKPRGPKPMQGFCQSRES
jgi:hypothetical protein